MRERTRISRIFYFEGVAFGIFISSIVLSLIELIRLVNGEFKFSDSPWMLVLPLAVSTYVSVRAMTEQSRLQTDFENDRYEREELLARAELPVALSDLVSSSARMLKYHFTRRAAQPDWTEFDRLFDKLKPAIRSSNKSTANRLLKVIRTYQVLRARMHDFDEAKRDDAQMNASSWAYHDIWSSAINWAMFHAMLEQAFAYARGIEDDIPDEPVSERVFSAFFINDIELSDYPLVSEIMDKRKARGFEMDFSDR